MPHQCRRLLLEVHSIDRRSHRCSMRRTCFAVKVILTLLNDDTHPCHNNLDLFFPFQLCIIERRTWSCLERSFFIDILLIWIFNLLFSCTNTIIANSLVSKWIRKRISPCARLSESDLTRQFTYASTPFIHTLRKRNYSSSTRSVHRWASLSFDNGEKKSFVVARCISTDICCQRTLVHLLIPLFDLCQINLWRNVKDMFDRAQVTYLWSCDDDSDQRGISSSQTNDCFMDTLSEEAGSISNAGDQHEIGLFSVTGEFRSNHFGNVLSTFLNDSFSSNGRHRTSRFTRWYSSNVARSW